MLDVSNASSNTTTRCPLFPEEESRCDILVYCKQASGVLSILGCTLTLIIIVLSKRHREFTQRLVAHLSVASLLFALSYIISDFDSKYKDVNAILMNSSFYHLKRKGGT